MSSDEVKCQPETTWVVQAVVGSVTGGKGSEAWLSINLFSEPGTLAGDNRAEHRETGERR